MVFGMFRPALILFVIAALLSACDNDQIVTTAPEGPGLIADEPGYEERTLFHQMDIELTVPIPYGKIDLYRLLDGEISLLQQSKFDHPNPSIYTRYETPLSSPDSAILMHVYSEQRETIGVEEFVCFVPISHLTTRHAFKLDCGYQSTIAYYLAATEIGQSGLHPFHDAQQRLPLWRAFTQSPDNDVLGFYVSVFGTLQKALGDMGRHRFDIHRHSLRPVMETIVTQFKDEFQRRGSISAAELIRIANRVTDNSLPLERLVRYQSIFEAYSHVEDIELENTGGSLTRRGRDIELLTMANELSRFYLRQAPFEMSDYRTRIVQNVTHRQEADVLQVTWDPIPHMYGYNVYYDGEHTGYTSVPEVTLPPDSRGSVTIRAVGYAGEFDGVHYDLSDPSLLAGVANNATP